MTGLDVLLGKVEWTALPEPDGSSDLPHATHQGWLEIGDMRLLCFQLSDGRRVFDAETFREAWGIGQ